MKISVEFDLSSVEARCTLYVDLKGRERYAARTWKAKGRAFDPHQLDEVWSALYDELDIQSVLDLQR